MADDPLSSMPTGGWSDKAQVDWYLDRVGQLEARRDGEQMFVEMLPDSPEAILDLGCGDGRLAALVLVNRPSVHKVIAIDHSPPMIERARQRFVQDKRIEVIEWDLNEPIGSPGAFDAVVSGFAIHHLDDARKRTLFGEVAGLLPPGGRFINLEVVASASERWHAEFLTAIGRTSDDPEDRLASVDSQLDWMRASGLNDCECVWRWRGFALLVGDRAGHELPTR